MKTIPNVPLVAAALRVLRGEVRERGVIHAEKALDPLPDLPQDGKLIVELLAWLA